MWSKEISQLKKLGKKRLSIKVKNIKLRWGNIEYGIKSGYENQNVFFEK